jgi:hypothetical protein
MKLKWIWKSMSRRSKVKEMLKINQSYTDGGIAALEILRTGLVNTMEKDAVYSISDMILIVNATENLVKEIHKMSEETINCG